MRYKIPKTDLLVTFEAVAQYESYTRAAEKLALTQSAVFRQITALEEFLNVSLFHHVRKRIFLNDAGRYYLDLVRDTLEQLEKDTQSIMSYQSTQQVLELAVTPTFSTHWLIPNLSSFHEDHPEIVLNLTALTTGADFLNLKYDAAIMREDFSSPWVQNEHLFEEELVPVCSRMLWRDDKKVMRAEQLMEEFTLLHQTTRLDAWYDWFALSGVNSPKVRMGPRLDLLSMLISAVRSNLGVALLPRFAIHKDLENGDMVIPCDLPMSTGNHFVLTYKDGKRGLRSLQKFSRWIHDKSKEEELKRTWVD
ncbi:TPA: LysR family transcriptional regulator [Yersinia enterocolitica]|uniref:LysR substrate-binding domain-containing protein n=1 Tax=Yersinia enterocolitica TaxID=630 RepID=UPI00094B8751|nr:LysR substrate-binding domain-containing protein [Yersinia enterocolitica]MBX9474790.1 LysR family transcriptional regulator [Yersinia enterocolitica]MBX9487544.1 LysR family transcriptional regulator [Yersinia enterocolitica]MBX9490988.1 LysR family transcriptional regulator [Yersinia enterocolitica]HDL8055023.1 LysR family transcriptional regulator [Yersinia enterocolitica]HDM8437399.1 LysR family transcriptional regulator [Yersinia enterocolitica]